MRQSWFRANRWWLLLLPFAIALMLAGSSYRVSTFWFENGFHDETARADPGMPLKVANHFSDVVGDGTRNFTVTLTGLTEVDEIPVQQGQQRPTPDGVTAYKVHLDFEADPREDMNYCTVSLVDSEDTRYSLQASGDPTGQSNVCVPEATPGPRTPILKGEKRGQVDPALARPRTWSVEPVVLVKDGTKPVEARLAFSWPEYVVLPLPR